MKSEEDPFNIQFPPLEKPLRLRNKQCVYCAREFGPDLRRTTEHVIGKNFSPDVNLQETWNLIVNSCEMCNNEKSRLEEEVSAISLQLGAFGPLASENSPVQIEAKRKMNGSVSSRTGRVIGQSRESTHIQMHGLPNGVRMGFRFRGPAQLDHSVAIRFAEMQVTAFFFVCTYDRKTGRGLYGPGAFTPYPIVPRTDWGNQESMAFQEIVVGWATRFNGTTMNGHFRVSLRRNYPHNIWSWALEWNQAIRIYGFFGDEALIRDCVGRIPKRTDASERVIRLRDGVRMHMRNEVPLVAADDRMFSGPARQEERSD